MVPETFQLPAVAGIKEYVLSPLGCEDFNIHFFLQFRRIKGTSKGISQ
jgi:hypothetical protein